MSISSRKVGELSKEDFVYREVVWKIPYVFYMPKFVDYVVESPSFTFAGATWRLKMYPNGQTSRKSQSIDLLIERLWSIFPEHFVYGIIFLRSLYNDQFKETFFTTRFSEMNPVEIVGYLQRVEVFGQPLFIGSNDTISFVFGMKIKKNSVSEAICQTELPEILEGTDDKVHVNKLKHDYKELLVSEEDFDVTIKIKDQQFGAHRNILKARSSVFASMFRSDMKEKATGVVDVDDCDPHTFPDFLYYLYCGSVDKLSGENVFSLYATADKYDAQDLKLECLKFMKSNLSVDNFTDTITLSVRYCEAELLKVATDFFTKNLPKIIVTVKWQSFLAQNPTYSNELMVKALASYKLTNG